MQKYPLMLYKDGIHDTEDPDYRIVASAEEESAADTDGYILAGSTPSASTPARRTKKKTAKKKTRARS